MNSDTNLLINENQAHNAKQASGLLSWIPRKLRIVLCILLAAAAVITLLVKFQPQAEKREIPETVVRVDVVEANRSSYPIVVTANGTIEAETRGNLVAQIRGEVVSMAENFKTGGTFKSGDELIQIDPRDYASAVSQTRASLSQTEAAYRQEQANAKQAVQDWQRLGNTEPASDLVLRKPQLLAAKAAMESAQATHATAKLNLGRTTITAPYDGRIIRRDAVLGQYVSIGTPIAEVFATQGVEVRLPLSQEEFSQLGLDSFNANDESANQFNVVLSSDQGNQRITWQAKITRTDSTFDINTRQIDVIALVEDPFGKQSGKAPLKIGQFVTARIQGRTVEDVYVIPNKSIREGSYLYVVREQRLAKQSIDILWQDDKNALIKEGISDKELVVTTSLNSTLAGAKAKLSETASTQKRSSEVREGAATSEQETNARTSEAPAATSATTPSAQ